MSTQKSCPNCGAHGLRRGKLVGRLDLGGSFGFRPRGRGWLGLFRKDIHVPREWTMCETCSLLWVFVAKDSTAREDVALSSAGNEFPQAPSQPTVKVVSSRHLIWNVGCFVPQALRRLGRSFTRLTQGTLSVLCAWLVLYAMMRILQPNYLPTLFFYSWIVGFLILMAWCVVIVRLARLRARVRERDYLMCPQCEYDLRGGHSGLCPECGIRYHDWELPIVWKSRVWMPRRVRIGTA
jgi:hypothetical protein